MTGDWFRTIQSVEVTQMNERGNFDSTSRATRTIVKAKGQMSEEQIRGKLAYALDRIIAGTKTDRSTAERILRQTSKYCTTPKLKAEYDFITNRL